MPDYIIYHAHTACSRVTLGALEEVGADYEDRLLRMQQGDHRSAEYLAINPQGKVPCLIAGDEVLTENGAILCYLHEMYPQAGLFPAADTPAARAHQLADLFWLSSVWHPAVRANKAPFLWTTGDVAPVKEKGRQLLMPLVQQLDARVSGQDWWYESGWSILDYYLWWAYVNAEIGGFPLDDFEAIAAHRARCEARPGLQRALAREQAAVDRAAD